LQVSEKHQIAENKRRFVTSLKVSMHLCKAENIGNEVENMTEEESNLRVIGTSTKGWKYKTMILHKGNINKDFVVLLNRRDIRKGNVSKLNGVLLKGEHFETPLVANRLNNKWRLIDGNHRYEAIKRLLERYPKRKVEIGVCYYENLTEDEEKMVFTKWNLGAKQSLSDFLKQYWQDIRITKKLKKPFFPWEISHKWGQGLTPAMEFKQLIGPYLVKDSDGDSVITHPGPAMNFIEASQELGDSDLKVLKQFMEEYMDTFGNPDKRNPMYRGCPFIVAMRIWLKNYGKINPAAMKKRLRKLQGHERAMFWSTQGASRTNMIQCLRDFLEVINRGLRLPRSRLI